MPPARHPVFEGWIVYLLALSFLCLPTLSGAAFGFKTDGSLDKDAISQAYFESEFTRILLPLEIYRQSFPASARKEDSIFVYKYLSVIYAADSSTRQRAESYMVQLLKINPNIELIDLYISDNIASIFKHVKQSHFQQQKYLREYDQFGNDRKILESSIASKSRSSNWFWWALGGMGIVAVGSVTYIALNDDNQTIQEPSDFKP